MLKPARLTDEEWVVMKRHPVYAYQWLNPIEYLRPALDIPFCHHENWIGMGFTRGLRAVEIPIAERIFAIVDVWDAITSDRPYHKAMPASEARQLIRDNTGSHFDPTIAAVFLELVT